MDGGIDIPNVMLTDVKVGRVRALSRLGGSAGRIYRTPGKEHGLDVDQDSRCSNCLAMQQVLSAQVSVGVSPDR